MNSATKNKKIVLGAVLIETLSVESFYNCLSCEYPYMWILDLRRYEDYSANCVEGAMHCNVQIKKAAFEQKFVGFPRNWHKKIVFIDNLDNVNREQLHRFVQMLEEVEINLRGKVNLARKYYCVQGGMANLYKEYPYLCHIPQENSVDLDPWNSIQTTWPSRIQERLYLGDWDSAKDDHVLNTLGITHIVNCTESQNVFEMSDQHRFIYHKVPINDNASEDLSQFLDQAIHFITTSLQNHDSKVLIHCHAGVSRSVAVCVAYLVSSLKLSFQDALDLVQKNRSVAQPNKGFLQCLRSYADNRRG